MIIIYILAAIGAVTVLGLAGMLLLLAISPSKMVIDDPYDRRTTGEEEEEQ